LWQAFFFMEINKIWKEYKMFVGKYNKSVVLTYIGVACSLFGMGAVVNGYLTVSMICLIVAGICDLFDGVVARKCKRDAQEKEFGVQIDSLADVISFLAFPAVIGLQMLPAYLSPILILYVLCGIIRLAWFNLSTVKEGSKGWYEGLPVTYVALILPIFYLILDYFSMSWRYGFTTVLYGVVAFLFVLKIKIRKPGGIWYGIFGVLAIVVTVLLLFRG